MRLVRIHDARRRYLPLLLETSQTSKASRNKKKRQRGRFSGRLERKECRTFYPVVWTGRGRAVSPRRPRRTRPTMTVRCPTLS